MPRRTNGYDHHEQPSPRGGVALDRRSRPEAPATGPYDGDELDLEALDADALEEYDGYDDGTVGGVDGVRTTDFGAVRLPLPEHGTVTVEPTANGRMQAVHITLPEGRLSVSALAAPKSSALWPELCREIDASLRDGGARVRSFTGAWGRELHATTGAATSVFVGVDGPRWMLYGVATGPTSDAVALDAELRRMLAGTIVVRGRSPYPVRTVLPLVTPAHLAEQAEEQAAPAPQAASPVRGGADDGLPTQEWSEPLVPPAGPSRGGAPHVPAPASPRRMEPRRAETPPPPRVPPAPVPPAPAGPATFRPPPAQPSRVPTRPVEPRPVEPHPVGSRPVDHRPAALDPLSAPLELLPPLRPDEVPTDPFPMVRRPPAAPPPARRRAPQPDRPGAEHRALGSEYLTPPPVVPSAGGRRRAPDSDATVVPVAPGGGRRRAPEPAEPRPGRRRAPEPVVAPLTGRRRAPEPDAAPAAVHPVPPPPRTGRRRAPEPATELRPEPPSEGRARSRHAAPVPPTPLRRAADQPTGRHHRPD